MKLSITNYQSLLLNANHFLMEKGTQSTKGWPTKRAEHNTSRILQEIPVEKNLSLQKSVLFKYIKKLQGIIDVIQQRQSAVPQHAFLTQANETAEK